MSIRFFTLLIVIISIFSCKKSNNDLCSDVVCYNNGSCIDGECECIEGFYGTYCYHQSQPELIIVDSIIISCFPENINGISWDGDGSLPDIYPQLLKGSTNAVSLADYRILVYKSTAPIQNASSGTTYKFIPDSTVQIDWVTGNYALTLWDFDTNIDDFVGGIYFTPYHDTNDFPKTLELHSSNISGICADLHISYLFE